MGFQRKRCMLKGVDSKMSTYYVCSDNIDGREQSRINALCDALRKKGHEAINGGVGPNTIQSHGESSSSTGQIGVFICGGVDIQVFWDFVQGISSGYYHYKRFIYVYASDTATSDKWLTCNGAKNTPTVQAHDDNYSGGQGDAIGKTVHQYCSEHKDIIWYACGKLGCSFDEVIQNFLSGIGAGDDKEEGSSASTIKDAIKEVASFWDGDVEIRVDQDKVKLRKIPDPETDHLENEIVEGKNVHLNSISVQDYLPDTINVLKVHWQGGEDIVIKDDALIERFGEKPKEMDAVKLVIKQDGETNTPSMTPTADTTTATSDTSISDSTVEDTSSASNSAYEEVPVDTYEEAQTFAKTEWAKIRRDNGHEIELKVIGDVNYKPAWVHVKLYSYPTDMWMYIKAGNHELSENGEFNTNLTLVDYPPSLGEFNETDSEEETEEEEETTDNEVVT